MVRKTFPFTAANRHEAASVNILSVVMQGRRVCLCISDQYSACSKLNITKMYDVQPALRKLRIISQAIKD